MNSFIPVCEPYLGGKEKEYVEDCLKTGWISSSGKYVTLFEEAFARYCDCDYAVAVCNGTVSLHLALTALGIKAGDEVIIPSFTMIASAYAVCYTGAKPVFVDACPKTWNIDTSKIEEKITEKTKAIMPVHIFGNPCNMDKIVELAQKYELYIVEDAAQAHGATYNGMKTGSFSAIASFSFFANKNLTTGEGGIVVTCNKELYDKCRYFKNLCFPLDRPRVYEHNDIGFNYRMSNLHAAIGLAQTERADDYRNMRISNNKLYKDLLKNVEGVFFQADQNDSLNVAWMNAVLIEPEKYGKSKVELMEHLKNNNIETRLLFTSLHKQISLQRFGCDCSGKYPVTVNLTENGFYLPSASTLQKEQIEFICAIIRDFQ